MDVAERAIVPFRRSPRLVSSRSEQGRTISEFDPYLALGMWRESVDSLEASAQSIDWLQAREKDIQNAFHELSRDFHTDSRFANSSNCPWVPSSDVFTILTTATAVLRNLGSTIAYRLAEHREDEVDAIERLSELKLPVKRMVALRQAEDLQETISQAIRAQKDRHVTHGDAVMVELALYGSVATIAKLQRMQQPLLEEELQSIRSTATSDVVDVTGLVAALVRTRLPTDEEKRKGIVGKAPIRTLADAGREAGLCTGDDAVTTATTSFFSEDSAEHALSWDGHVGTIVELLIEGRVSKSRLEGFYDPCEGTGVAPQLFVRYVYGGKLHEVTVGDMETLKCPLKIHRVKDAQPQRQCDTAENDVKSRQPLPASALQPAFAGTSAAATIARMNQRKAARGGPVKHAAAAGAVPAPAPQPVTSSDDGAQQLGGSAAADLGMEQEAALEAAVVNGSGDVSLSPNVTVRRRPLAAAAVASPGRAAVRHKKKRLQLDDDGSEPLSAAVEVDEAAAGTENAWTVTQTAHSGKATSSRTRNRATSSGSSSGWVLGGIAAAGLGAAGVLVALSVARKGGWGATATANRTGRV